MSSSEETRNEIGFKRNQWNVRFQGDILSLDDYMWLFISINYKLIILSLNIIVIQLNGTVYQLCIDAELVAYIYQLPPMDSSYLRLVASFPVD